MTTSTNPLIGASARETVENATEALSAVIELMPEASPIKFTSDMEAKMKLIFTEANIAHCLTAVCFALEDIANPDPVVVKGALSEFARAHELAEASITDVVDQAAASLSQLIVCISDEHSGMCRLLSPILHALECVVDEPTSARGFSRAESRTESKREAIQSEYAGVNEYDRSRH